MGFTSSKKSADSKCQRGWGETEPSFTVGGNINWYTSMKIPPLLGIYPKKTTVQKDPCTPVFTAALFTTAKTRKQPKCPLTDDWKKMWHANVDF